MLGLFGLLALNLNGCGDSGETPEVLVQRGNLLRDEGREDEAEGVYREAVKGFLGYLEDEPDSAYTWFQLGEMYYRLNEREKSLEAYKNSTEYSTEYREDAYVWYQIADLQDRPDHAQEALEAYNLAIRYNPEDSIAYNDRGWLYFDVLGETELAIRDFSEAIRLDPEAAFSLGNRALANSTLGNFSDALADWNQVIAIQPNLPGNYFDRGEVRRELGDFTGAIEDYSQAILLDPGFGLAYLGRGLARRELGQSEEADQDFRFARQVDPNLVPPLALSSESVDSDPALAMIVVAHLEQLGYANLRLEPTEAFKVNGERDGAGIVVFIASSSTNGTVNIMADEVASIRESMLPVDLVVVSQVDADGDLQVVNVVRDWSPADSDLQPIQYQVTLP